MFDNIHNKKTQVEKKRNLADKVFSRMTDEGLALTAKGLLQQTRGLHCSTDKRWCQRVQVRISV